MIPRLGAPLTTEGGKKAAISGFMNALCENLNRAGEVVGPSCVLRILVP